ncbi:MAG: glycerate kinase [Deltaproteobacteria bacterium]|nr:MAG: glycerate kinase [Deltaproteobacteria bacterium]
MDLEVMRKEAREIFLSSIKAVDPYEAVKRALVVEDGTLLVNSENGTERELRLVEYSNIYVVGGGKATAPMARAIEELLGDRISRGLINVKYGFTEPLQRIETVEAGHPLPDENGLVGTKRIIGILREASENDLVFSVISGGGSALLPLPAGDITLQEKQKVTQMLLDCGASIDEINAVRKHISLSKGGQMARAAYPATTINLMLSDVVGDRVDVIASGPFVPDVSTFRDALEVFKKYGIQDLPKRVDRYLKEGQKGNIPETPKQGDPVFRKVSNIIVGSNIIALRAAEKRARHLGYNTLILSSMIEGETKDVARVHSAITKEILKSGLPVRPPACIISGGETTVTINGSGKGGRNQEFCLAAAMDLRDLPHRVVILSGGTDGNDGPTDAAGGIVDPYTLRKATATGLDPLSYLHDNDAYHFLAATGDLLVTGPTRTNVMDVHLILVR